MSNFVELITLGFDENEVVRNAHQEKIVQMRATHTEEFFKCSVDALINDNTPEQTKQKILTILGHSLKPSSVNPQNNLRFYELCDENMISEIQQAVSKYLVHDKKSIVQAAAQCLSVIYIQEQVHGRMDDFIVIVQENAKSDNIQFKTSSILTLGYICEDLSTENIQLRNKDVIEEIIAGICHGLNLNSNIDEDILLTSLNALRNSIKFAADCILDIQKYRDHVMGLLVQIIESNNVPDEAKALSYSNISEIADFFYTLFADYMQKIAEISKIDLSSKDESVAMAVTNMWNQFALCEITLLEQRQNVALITQYKNEVVPYMMLNLTKTDGIEEDDDNMQNTIFSTSVVTLENINKLIGPEIEQLNMEFMESKFSHLISHREGYIESKNKTELIAALHVYGFFVNYANKQKAASTFDQSASNLMSMLFTNKNDVDIKIAVMNLLIKISQNNSNLLLSRNFLHQNLEQLIHSIETFEIRIVTQIFKFFEVFSDQVSINKLQQTDLNHNVDNIVQNIINCISQNRADMRDTQYIDLGFKTVLRIINNWFSSKNINFFLPKFCNMLQQLGTIKTEIEDYLFDGFLICIQICLHKSYQFDTPIQQSDLMQLFNQLSRLFSDMRRIKPEGVLTICTIGLGMGQKLSSVSQDIFNIMKEAMSQKEYNEDQMSAAILDGVSLLIRESRGFDNQIMDDYIISLLLHCFQNKEYPQEQRVNLFNNLGDISFEYFMVLIRYMPQIYENFKNGMEAAVKFIGESQDTLEYANMLKHSIVDAFLCIVHGFEKHKNEVIIDDKTNFGLFINDYIFKFVTHTCLPKFSPSIEYQLQCLSLLSDIIAIDLNYFSHIHQNHDVQDMFKALENYKDEITSDGLNSKSQKQNTLQSDIHEALDYFKKIVNKSLRTSKN